MDRSGNQQAASSAASQGSEPHPLKVQVGGDHYKNLPIQPVEYILANGLGYLEGVAITYVTRWRSKGGLVDLHKAKHTVELMIAEEERRQLVELCSERGRVARENSEAYVANMMRSWGLYGHGVRDVGQ